MTDEQVKQAKELAGEILGLMQERVQSLWKKEDDIFLKTLADDVAKEKILAETSGNAEEHLQNLRHLAATLRGEMARKGLRIKTFQKDMFIEILTTIIKTVAITVLKAAIKK